jgi:hypothetical protein
MHPEVVFVASDPNKEADYPKASHYIQVCDALVGAVRRCHEAVSECPGRLAVAETLLPLVERINCSRRCRNKKSRYGHVGRCSLSFFPSHGMSMEELLDPDHLRVSRFYRDRPLVMAAKQSRQGAFNL